MKEFPVIMALSFFSLGFSVATLLSVLLSR